jgi:hypothetical protein
VEEIAGPLVEQCRYERAGKAEAKADEPKDIASESAGRRRKG